MRYLKSGLMLLSATLMSGGCEQSTSENFTNALTAAKAKMNSDSATGEVSMACPAQAEHSAELVRLKQQLQRVQQQLAQSNLALVAAKKQLQNVPSTESQFADSIEQKQTKLSLERRVNSATTKHVNQLERRLTEQDLQLGKLHRTLIETEAGCREIADELARKNTSS